MKQLAIISFICVFMFSLAINSNAKDEIPPWMEDVKVKGRSTYLVPKGVKREVIGAQIVVEPPNEYTARKLYEMEQYLEKQFKRLEEESKK